MLGKLEVHKHTRTDIRSGQVGDKGAYMYRYLFHYIHDRGGQIQMQIWPEGHKSRKHHSNINTHKGNIGERDAIGKT